MNKKYFLIKRSFGGLLLVVAVIYTIFYIMEGVREREKNKYETTELYAMDTYFTMRIYGQSAKKALQECEKTVRELEELFSVTDDHSDVWRINHEKKTTVGQETFELISDACLYGEATEGALDITLYPVLQEWGFTTGKYKIPEEQRLKRLLSYVDYRQIEIFDQSSYQSSYKSSYQSEGMHVVCVPENVQIDLGAVAKGYTGDTLIDILRQEGVTSAILDLGGNVQTLGTKPDGSLWKVAVRNPFDKNKQLGVLEIKDKCVITSGNYERYFTGEDGKNYGHILDPVDGYPVDNDLASVTVIGEKGEACDAFSTALFVMGKERAIEFWRKQPLDFDMILVTNQGKLYMTQGLRNHFISEEGWETEIIYTA